MTTPTSTANPRNVPVFKKLGYPDSAIPTGKDRAQEIDRETALQTSQNEETNRIPFTHTYHPQNIAVKDVILKTFKILRNDPETKHVIPLPALILFKRDKNVDNFLVRSAFKLSLTTNRKLLNVHEHDTKLVPLFLTWLRSQDRIGPLKSLPTLHASP